jgi:hypothetical protein
MNERPSDKDSHYLKTKGLSLVGVAGFEPATTRTPSVCATRLRHTPTDLKAVRIAARRERSIAVVRSERLSHHAANRINCVHATPTTRYAYDARMKV